MDQEKYNEAYQSRDQQAYRQKGKPAEKEKVANYCQNCGTLNESGANFCEECGNNLAGFSCAQCGKELIPGADLCEHCGTLISLTACSFCGSEKEEDVQFCGECGAPSEGIQCTCGQISFHNFCSACNAPLTDAALAELENAKKDPEYREVLDLMQEIAVLQTELKADSHFEHAQPSEEEKQAEALRLQEIQKQEELEMLRNLSRIMHANANKENTAPQMPKRKPVERPQSSFDSGDREKALERAKEKEKELAAKRQALQEKLDAMAAKTFPSPQEARNFFDARKPPVENLVWNCKFNDSVHPDPQNCGQPQHGGKWIIYEGEIEWVTHDGTA